MKMKKMLFVSLGTILALSTISANAIASTLNENCIERVTSTNVESFVDVDPALNSLENELKNKGTTINEQLEKFLEEDLKYFSPEEAELVKKGIKRQDVVMNDTSLNADYKLNAFLPEYKLPSIMSDTAIAEAALAYLKYKGYTLSAHLLSRALYVRSSQEYQPPNEMKRFLYKTEAYKSLRRKDKYPNGSVKDAEFKNTYNRDEADAHYSIYHFRAEMTHNRVKIKDTYDYDEGKSEGAVGVAVDALARLQKKGLFVAYPLRIHLER
ncbi:hypothetical protein [Peptostreptococcus stomatis]